MSVYKVLLRCPFRGTQVLKKIYESDAKFEKYGKSYADRAMFDNNVEVYKMVDEKYELIYTLEMPITGEQIKQYVEDRNIDSSYTTWRIRDLEEQKEYFKKVWNKELKNK